MDNSALRRTMYGMLLVITVGMTGARIANVENVAEPSIWRDHPRRTWPATAPEPSPTFSSNDRARWATVRALVDRGTFAIGERIDDPSTATGYRDVGILWESSYRTIDVVLHPQTKKFYGSKPPLFTCMVAGEYWLLKKLFGWDIEVQRWPVVCTILVTFNIVPLVVFLLLLARFLEEYGRTDWGRLFVFASACFGTFMTAFAVALNNHTPAACCIMFAVMPLLRGLRSGFTSGQMFAVGLFSGLAIAFDLPCASFAGLAFLLVAWQYPRGLLVYIPMLALAPALLLAANYISLGDWIPAYARFGTEWYEYPGSHWLRVRTDTNPSGIDAANEPKGIYLFHNTLGHHGLFSLTPIWILSLIGAIRGLRSTEKGVGLPIRVLSAFTLILMSVILAYYTWKTNNYGGWTSGPRWFFWMTPLMLLSMVGICDRVSQSAWMRWAAYLALGISAFSVAWPVFSPWRHPWILQLLIRQGWLIY